MIEIPRIPDWVYATPLYLLLGHLQWHQAVTASFGEVLYRLVACWHLYQLLSGRSGLLRLVSLLCRWSLCSAEWLLHRLRSPQPNLN